MTKRFFLFLISMTLSFVTQNLIAQYKLDFGDINIEDLSNKPYKPDPGASAIMLSDIGVAKLNYVNKFYVEFERDVRIKIVNSNGFDYADIEIPYSAEDNLDNFRASSFNLRNGEKIETKLFRKDFIIENVSKYRKALKFNMPDVHEGTVIEYSYIIRLRDESISVLVPWVFQRTIPIVNTSLTVAYPEYFIYKNLITGNPMLVNSDISTKTQYFGAEETKVIVNTWYASNVPAFVEEPVMKSLKENQTKIAFELASVNFNRSSFEEISPTYETMTKKLLEREDFGMALSKARFLKKLALNVTQGLTDDLSKVKAIHRFISEKILWDGFEDYTTSSALKTVYNKEKGNSADINMMLIGMLRGLGIKADPVILSTRSNGSINQLFAMMQQFNYVVAYITLDSKNYIIDATDPERPFDLLPFECLNGSGRLIEKSESRFVDLKNSEKNAQSFALDLSITDKGSVEGNFSRRSCGYAALDIRKTIRLEGEEGYEENVRNGFNDCEITDFRLNNLALRDSDILETCRINMEEGLFPSGDKMIFNPYFSFVSSDNPFSSPERSFPVDFGCPVEESFLLSIEIPDGYSVSEVPDNVSYSLGKDNGRYEFTCKTNDKKLLIKSSLQITRPTYAKNEYNSLRDFYAKILLSQARQVIMKKKI